MSQIKEHKILIIEDEKSIADALMLKLQKEGFKVDIAFGGEEALTILQPGKYSLIFCDLIMPTVDGFMILKTLRDKKINTPVVVLTNLSDVEYEKKAKDLGAAGLYVKTDTPLAHIVKIAKSFIKE